MNELPAFGFDIGKHKIHACLLRDGCCKHKVFCNDIDGFQALRDWLAYHEISRVHACMEAAGGWSEALAKPGKLQSLNRNGS